MKAHGPLLLHRRPNNNNDNNNSSSNNNNKLLIVIISITIISIIHIYIYIYIYLHIRIHVYPPSTNLEVTSWKIKRANENILRTALAPREWTRFNIEFGGGGKVSGRFTAKAVCQQHRYSLEADKV